MAPTTTPGALPVYPIRREDWSNFLGLIWTLSLKNFRVRYKRAALGVVWAVLQPTIQAVVLALLFTRVLHVHSVAHYPTFILSGLLPWAWFAGSMPVATTAILDNSSLVKKVAVPLLIYPLSSAGGVALASAASLPILLVASAAAGQLSIHVLYIVPAIALELLTICGLGALTAAFHPAYRDVRYMVDSLLLIGFYATPIVFQPRKGSLLSNVLLINPMTGVLNLFHNAMLRLPIDWYAVGTSLLMGVALLIAGVWAFQRQSGEFVDLV